MPLCWQPSPVCLHFSFPYSTMGQATSRDTVAWAATLHRKKVGLAVAHRACCIPCLVHVANGRARIGHTLAHCASPLCLRACLPVGHDGGRLQVTKKEYSSADLEKVVAYLKSEGKKLKVTKQTRCSGGCSYGCAACCFGIFSPRLLCASTCVRAWVLARGWTCCFACC